MTWAALLAAVLGFNVAAPLGFSGAIAFLGDSQQAAQFVIKLQQKFDTPATRAWAARNGAAAIHSQPGISRER